ncbi:hypothetical protein Oter_3742 [Opitutus terrae PB90-1]|uniref:Uncharacterized protein TP-0789 domain-containing protein n=1 Tax=Opitutus terrae (strain DSM 11246 / JCM 15787 / PB90-1) TaxID=452637 RepID=B1ZYB9_OPITP|nr:hypothetical protein Oter_3742 [Opitutus terrae PB90-1]
MRFSGRAAPARLWRAFLLATLAGGLITPALWAQASRTTSRPPLISIGKPDPDDARKALEQLRRQGIAGNYYLELQVRIMPRRGAERFVLGRLWGGRNEIGPLTRVSLTPEDGAGGEQRLLIQNGRESGVWRWQPGRGPEQLGIETLLDPLIPDTELTAFDLQMPFVYWEQFTYEGLRRFRGRPAHVIELQPPPEFAARHPDIGGVRVHLDSQFNALVQTELLDRRGAVLKTLSLVDLKKVDDQWIPKTLDIRDERTRNKTRVSVTAAALGLEFAGPLFEPAQLAEAVRPPPEDRLTRIED